MILSKLYFSNQYIFERIEIINLEPFNIDIDINHYFSRLV
jgi:hypothetical protein